MSKNEKKPQHSLRLLTGIAALFLFAGPAMAEKHAKPIEPKAEVEAPKAIPAKPDDKAATDKKEDAVKASDENKGDKPDTTTAAETAPDSDATKAPLEKSDDKDEARIPSDGEEAPATDDDTAYGDFKTNQSEIEGLEENTVLEIGNVEGAFAYVFSQLPDRVFVYPTENYYYFSFSASGVVYAGNLRLARRDRDDGILHFAVFPKANAASPAGDMLYKAMSEKDGVIVEKHHDLAYHVTYKGKQVHFELNDVSKAKPPEDIVAEGEKYLGLVSDESGMRFFFFYNEVNKLFTYVLDETSTVLDEFTPMEKDSRILIGHRTGFAVYDHHTLDRRVLIGVHADNILVNNYFDGPGDQLPENHYKGDELKDAIIASNPDMEGKVDKLGYLASGEGRYLIAPYKQYYKAEELKVFDQCANDPTVEAQYYDGCFDDYFLSQN